MTEQYKDRGCNKAKAVGYSGTCLACPLPECLKDTLNKRYKLTPRNNEIKRLYKSGIKTCELAEKFNLSVREIKRVLHENL